MPLQCNEAPHEHLDGTRLVVAGQTTHLAGSFAAGSPAVGPAIGSTLAARQDGVDYSTFCGYSSGGTLTGSVCGSALNARSRCPSSADGTAYGSNGYQACGWGPERGADLHHVICSPCPQRPSPYEGDISAFGPLPDLSTGKSGGSRRTHDRYGVDLSYNIGGSGVGCSLISYATHNPHAGPDPMAHCAAPTVISASSGAGGFLEAWDYQLPENCSARPEWQNRAGFPAVIQGPCDSDMHIADESGRYITHSGCSLLAGSGWGRLSRGSTGDIDAGAPLLQQAVPKEWASQAARQLPWPASQTTAAPAALQFCDGGNGGDWDACTQTPMELLPGDAWPAPAIQPCGVGTSWPDLSSTAGTSSLLLPPPHCDNVLPG